MHVQAARLIRHGAPIQVEEVELPEPGPGESLAQLEFGGVNPIDGYVAIGQVAPDGPLPRTLGAEAAGTIDGRNVLIAGASLGAARDGVWAGAAVVPNKAVYELPDGVGCREAAAMGIAGLTAYNVVHGVGHVGPDDRVLVLGASGGVGSVIVSVAHAVGATVWGQTGSESKAALIQRQGADRVVVSGPDELARQIAELEPTVVLDPLGGAFMRPAIEALAVRGRYVAYGVSAGAEVTLDIRRLYRSRISLLGYGGTQLTDEERRTGLERALAALADGTLKVPIDDVVALEAVNEALGRFAARDLQGNVLLALGS
jgi:NADPH2:quinone reductase